MQAEEHPRWAQWLAIQGERIRLLNRLQEEAISQQQWETLLQLTAEKEQLLEPLWETPPAQLPPAVLAFAQELWHANERLQQLMAQQFSALHAEMAEAHHLRENLQRYYAGPPPGSVADRSA